MKKVRITCERVFRFEQIVEMPDEEFEEIQFLDGSDISMMDDGYDCISAYIDWSGGDCEDEIQNVEVEEIEQ